MNRFSSLYSFYRPVYIHKIGYATIQAQGGSVHDYLEITAGCIDVLKHGRNRLHAEQQRAGHGRHFSHSAASKMAGTGAKTKLKFWSTGRHDANYIKEVIHRYNQENPDNIEVEMTVMADDFAQSLDLSFASEQSPDIFTPIDLAEMTRKGYVEPLNEYITPVIRSRFGKQAFIEGYNVFDQWIYSLPNSGSTLRLIYNVELFARAGITSPPKSLDELVEAAWRITEIGKAEGVYGFALPYKIPASASAAPPFRSLK